MTYRSYVAAAWIVLAMTRMLTAQEAPQPPSFLAFVRGQAEKLRAGDRAAATGDEWQKREQTLRAELLRAWGGFPLEACPLEARKLGELARDGYRVEKVIFQTLPGLFMTANAYVPDKPGPLPAVLCVHGHWANAKQDPIVQSRCIGLAKLGFFVLVVDAFGAGERAVGKALGEYHGEMTGALLLPIGRPLSGIQVYENMRAVDYLRSRTEVDPQRIGITGASGGGNQSMYAGAFDKRFAAAVPVCSVGNYHAYLGAACCMCEVVPGALTFTDEGDLLGLTAPRGLMVISATRDAPQFSVAEAQKSLARAGDIFRLAAQPTHVRHTIIESAHDYNQPMREAMYGWMTKFLKGKGDGSPIAEPEHKTELPETLRCYPGQTRPDDYVTIPRFAAAEARRLLAAHGELPQTAEDWAGELKAVRDALNLPLEAVAARAASAKEKIPEPTSAVVEDGAVREVTFWSEPGVRLTARLQPPEAQVKRLAVLLDFDGAAAAEKHTLAKSLRDAGRTVLTLDLRATGKQAVSGDRIGAAPDHNSAEWALWIGRPLLHQWVLDVEQSVRAVTNSKQPLESLDVIGIGPAGIVALYVGAVHPDVTSVTCVGTPTSYVSESPYRGWRLGLLVPGILRDVGDIPHIAATIAPRRLVIADGLRGDGSALDGKALREAYEWPTQAYAKLGKPQELRLTTIEGVANALLK